jgi:hypothetical protein
MPLDDVDKTAKLPLATKPGILGFPVSTETTPPDVGDWRKLKDPSSPTGVKWFNIDTQEEGGYLGYPGTKEHDTYLLYPDWYHWSAWYGEMALDIALLLDAGVGLSKLGVQLTGRAKNAWRVFKGRRLAAKETAEFFKNAKNMSVQKIFDSLGGHAGGDPKFASQFAKLDDVTKNAFIKGLKSDTKAQAKAFKAAAKPAPEAPTAIQKLLGHKPSPEHAIHTKMNELKKLTKTSVDKFTPQMLEDQIALTDDILELAESLPVSQQHKVVDIVTELSKLHGPIFTKKHNALSRFTEHVNWQEEASKLGITFNGMQEFGDRYHIPLFTDDMPGGTGTTFTVEPGETVLDALNRKRAQFKAPLFNETGAIDLSKFKLKKRSAVEPQTQESADAIAAFGKNKNQVTKYVAKASAAKVRALRRFFTVPTAYMEKELMKLSKGVEFTDIEGTEALQVLADMIFARQGPHALASQEILDAHKHVRRGLSNAESEAYDYYRVAQRIDSIAKQDVKRKGKLTEHLAETDKRISNVKALIKGTPAKVKRVLNAMGIAGEELPPEVVAKAKKELKNLQKIRDDIKGQLAVERRHIMPPEQARAFIADVQANEDLMQKYTPRDEYLEEFYTKKLNQLVKEGSQTIDDAVNMKKAGFYNFQYWLGKIDPDTPFKRQIPRSISVSRSGRLKPLGSGDIEALETDTMALVNAYANMVNSIIMRNRAGQSARKLALANPDNDIFMQPTMIDKDDFVMEGYRTLEEAQEHAEGVVKWADAPEGWRTVFTLEEGIETPLWIREDYEIEWITQDPLINKTALKIFQWMGLSKPVKFMATGPGNPLWGLTGNMMMDLATSYITQYQYSAGSDVISHLAKASRNMVLVADDVLKSRGIVKDRYEAGAGISMLFEEWQGPKLMGERFPVPSKASEEFEAWANIVTYLNSTSEEAMRAADTLQSARDLVAKKNIKVTQTMGWDELKKHLTPEESRRIHYTALARGNFPHAGAFWQYFDTIAPYTRASYAVSRNQYIMAKKHPKAFAWRIANIMAVTASLYGVRKLMSEKYAQFDPQAELNNWLLPIPGMEYKDKDGAVRQQALKIKKEPIVRPVSAFTTAMLDYALYGIEPDRKQLFKAAQEILPYAPEASTFPAFSLIYGWSTGRDLQTGRPIWTGRPVSDPSLEVNMDMHPIWVGLGENLGTSPVKLRHSLQQIFTYSSPVVQGLALPLSAVMEGMPYEYREQGWGKVRDIPGGKKLIAASQPSNEFYQILEDSKKVSGDTYERIDGPLEAALAAWSRGEISKGDLLEEADKLLEAEPTHVERVVEKINTWERWHKVLRLYEDHAEVKYIPRTALFSLKNADPESRAVAIYETLSKRNSVEQAVFWEAMNIMGRNEHVSRDKRGRMVKKVTNGYYTDNCVTYMGRHFNEWKNKIDLSVMPKNLRYDIEALSKR